MTCKKKSRAAVEAARLPKPVSRKTADHAKVASPSHAEGIGVSTGSPSAAWLRMKEKARRPQEQEQFDLGPADQYHYHRARPVPGQDQLFANKDKTLHSLESESRAEAHNIMKCPYCIAPGYVQNAGWPEPCRVRITENVECHSTSSAAEIGHHYSCPFWDHTDGLPF